MIPVTRAWILTEGIISKPTVESPALCWRPGGKYRRRFSCKTPGHSLRSPLPPDDPTLPFYKSTPQSRALSSHCRLPGGTSPPPLCSHTQWKARAHTTHTILRGHLPGAGAQLEPRVTPSAHSAPLPRKGHSPACSAPRVPRGQRRPGLRPHIPGPGTAGGAQPSQGRARPSHTAHPLPAWESLT